MPDDPLALPHPAMMHMPSREMTSYSLYCGLWRTDGGFVSTIHIKNSLISAPLIVTPALYAPEGNQLTLPPITIPAGGETDVNINRALAALAPPGAAPSYGSAGLSYMWSSPGHIVASTQMLDAGRSLIFTASFLPPHVVQPTGIAASIPDPGPAPHRIEMLWWRRDAGVHELLSVANTSGADLDLSYAVTGSSGAPLPAQALTLGAHQSQLIDLSSQIAQLPQYLASTGGITITYHGILGQLLVAGLLENDTEGYSDHMPYAFHDPGTALRQYRYAATGMLAGKPAPALGFRSSLRFFPYVVLRNASAGSLDVHITVNWEPEGSDDGTGAGSAPNQSYALPPLRFAPGASAQLDMQGVLHAAGLDGFDGSVNLLVSYTGHEGDLVMGAGSVDQSGSFVFAVLPEPVRRSFGRRASYWATGGGYDTMITLWNTGSTAEDILVRLRYADGSGRYTAPVHLAPMSSRTIDLWQLIAAARPDHKGRQFNMTEQTGSISFESATSHTTWLHLNADIAVYNSKNGTCGCYCDPCCAYDNFGMSPATLLVSVNGNPVALVPFGCYCNGTQDVLEADITITNTNTAIYVNGGLIGVSPGTTAVNVDFEPVVMGGVDCYGAYNTQNCYSAPATLQPPPPAVVTACGDPPTPQSGNRGALIQEYITYAVGFTPVCSDFTDSASTTHFTFQELTVSEDYSWAILRSALLTGVEAVRTDNGNTPLTISSGYRNPAHNAAVGGANDSQHMYGTAVDFATGGSETLWGGLHAAALEAGACAEPLANSTYSHVHADWRAGTCPAGWRS